MIVVSNLVGVYVMIDVTIGADWQSSGLTPAVNIERMGASAAHVWPDTSGEH